MRGQVCVPDILEFAGLGAVYEGVSEVIWGDGQYHKGEGAQGCMRLTVRRDAIGEQR